MKFLRVGEQNKEIPAILDKENKIRSLSNYINDFNPDTLNFNTIDKIKNLDFKSLPEISSEMRELDLVLQDQEIFLQLD